MQPVSATEQSEVAGDSISAAQKPVSQREREILVLVAHGFSNIEIGERLSITRTTVRTHLENIFEKLSVRDRTEAVVKYFFAAEREKAIGDIRGHFPS